MNAMRRLWLTRETPGDVGKWANSNRAPGRNLEHASKPELNELSFFVHRYWFAAIWHGCRRPVGDPLCGGPTHLSLLDYGSITADWCSSRAMREHLWHVRRTTGRDHGEDEKAAGGIARSPSPQYHLRQTAPVREIAQISNSNATGASATLAPAGTTG
jgi:hypothetical protein